MSKKIKNVELLVAEIHTIQSKLESLKSQHKANQLKIERLKTSQSQIEAKATNLKKQLDRDMTLANNNNIAY
jgi:chromosome segregation ATPase